MKRESGYYNRNARRSGGDRHFIIGGGRQQGRSFDALRLAIWAYIESHPNESLEQVGASVLKFPGATIERVTEILKEYCSDEAAAPAQGEE